MATFDSNRRVGRSQAASIFWGLISVFFAAAACYYFWKSHGNEVSANVLRDQVLNLQEQRETLSSQRDKLQAGISETETQLKTREDFLDEKEAKLAQEETQIEGAGAQSQNQAEQNRSQAVVVKKFNDAVRKLVKDDTTDVVVRGGRPVLRVPASVFFAYGEATLKPAGKALLNQIVQALSGQFDGCELRIDAFTDSDGEIPDTPPLPNPLTPPPDNPPSSKSDPDQTGKPAVPPAKPRYTTAWDLTGARAGALARYFHDQTPLSFRDVVVSPRGDFQPIFPKQDHARNRRLEITIVPLPPPFYSEDGTSGTEKTPPSENAEKAKKAETATGAKKET